MIVGFSAKTSLSIFFSPQFFFSFFKILIKGVHVVARKGRPIAILEHLNRTVGVVSLQQKTRLVRMQKSLEIVRRYRMSKVS